MADSPRIEELRRRVQSDPASIAFAALAEEYRRAGRFEEAIETCTAGLIRHPSYLSAHVTLGRALVEVGRLEDARSELEYVLRLAPENLAAIRALAEIHDRLGEAHEPAGKSRAHEAASPELTVAEIHAASGFRQAAAEETPPFFAPTAVEPQPSTPLVSPTWEPEPSTPLVSPTWEPDAMTPPASVPLDSRGTTARSGPPPWEVEPFAVADTLEAEPAPSYSAISMEDPAPEAPPVLASVSHIHETPADELLVDFSTSSGSSRAKSSDDSARVTRLEAFLEAILRARAERGASR